MPSLNKDFFTGNEVLFVGFSEKQKPFCMSVYKAFGNKGIKVYPVNSRSTGNFDVKVFKSLAELPKIPETAYVLLNKENTKKVIKQLADSGVKRILFQSKRNVDADTVGECAKLGIETVVACPMMVFGTAIHKIHGFFAGVR